jgi:hydroxymethylbilane synthase
LQPPVRIGTRASVLARTQSGHVQAQVAAALGAAPEARDAVAPLVFITTTGDRVQDRRLIEEGGKALFTKEIEEALLDGRVDLAVHSMKDVPAEQPPGLVIAAVPEREDPRDALISRRHRSLDELPHGARVGTVSLRRQAQLLARRPDLKIVPMRGNVDTRLKKLDDGECDALVLAAAGLNRLGRAAVVSELLDPVSAPPAPGQGALAIQCREADAGAGWLQRLHHAPTALCVAAERGALQALEASCRTAVGAYARLDGHLLRVSVEALAADGAIRWRLDEAIAASSSPAEARELGARLGRAIRDDAGDHLLVVG